MWQKEVFQNINRNTLVKVFKASGLPLNCSPVFVISIHVAAMGARVVQSFMGTTRVLKWGTKAQKIGENTLVVSMVISGECREGLGKEQDSSQLCSSSPLQNGGDAVVLTEAPWAATR